MNAAFSHRVELSRAPEPRFVVTSQPFFRFPSEGVVEVRNERKRLQLPVAAFQALMQFLEPRTMEEAGTRLGGLSLEDVDALIRELEGHGLIAPVVEAPTDVDVDDAAFAKLFRPGVFDDEASVEVLSRHLVEGRAIVIPDALRPDIADRIHGDLASDLAWQNVEEFDQVSHFRFRSLDFDRHLPTSARMVRDLAASPGAKRLLSRLSGLDCHGATDFSASWYRPGDFTHPHDDAHAHRSVAGILNVTKDWDPTWGGALFWAPSGASITPRFNTLTLFNVSKTSVHQVLPVSPLAVGKRLTLNMWWANRKPRLALPRAHYQRDDANAAGVTPHAYGNAPMALPHRIVAI